MVRPTIAIAAEIIRFVSRPPCEMACPPIKEPSEIPRKRALLFQARMVARPAGNSFVSLIC